METIDIFGFQLDFVKDLLREHINSKDSDMDTRLMANDILEQINRKHTDLAREMCHWNWKECAKVRPDKCHYNAKREEVSKDA